ncbi:hypothetical protein TWF481_001130 [Arthrobotrys musiformis]|uniref:Uncharacterized protein n=1 Tax=Arthrobotrys musiformis TaxID=47236 RepID=A0AAV9WQH9_9PEZI
MPIKYIVSFYLNSNWFLYDPNPNPRYSRTWDFMPEKVVQKYGTEATSVATDVCFSTWGADWFHAYLAQDEETQVEFWELSNSASYPRLREWLSQLPDKLIDKSSLYVSLGPEGSFFARCNLGYRWHGLPDTAELILQSFLSGNGWKVKPYQFLFGESDAFVLISTDGDVYYNKFKRHVYPLMYDELDRIMSAGGMVQFLSFRPSSGTDFFIVYNIDGNTCVLPYAESMNANGKRLQDYLIRFKRRIKT